MLLAEIRRALTVVVLLSAVAAHGEDVQFTSFADRLDRLEADYVSLTSQMSTLNDSHTGVDGTFGCPHTAGLVGGAAVVFARPWISGSMPFRQEVTVNPTLVRSDPSFDHDFSATPRVWIGYQNVCGGGVRARYWRFEGDTRLDSIIDTGLDVTVRAEAGTAGTGQVTGITSAPGVIFLAFQDLKLDVIDLEYTRQLEVRWGSCTVSGGLRYARFKQSLLILSNLSASDFITSAFKLDGLGPSVAVEAILPTRFCNLSVFGTGRVSILLSQFDQRVQTFDGPLIDDLVSNNRDHVVGAFESELGVRWERQHASGATLFAQCSVEGQLWTEMAHSRNDLTNLGFLGLAAAIGISR